MNIAIINGSPKSELSVTQQYVRFLEQNNPDFSFSVVHIAKHLKSLEKKPDTVSKLVERIRRADLIIWSFPVYYFLVPSQLKRFIELIFTHHPKALQGKYCTALTTSIHFFDHTAHEYVHAVSEDLGMKHLPPMSAGMNDLLKEPFRKSFLAWFRQTLQMASQAVPVEQKFTPLQYAIPTYKPSVASTLLDPGDKKIVLISDASDSDKNLLSMEKALASTLNEKLQRISLESMGMKGGCMGCLKCGWDGNCFYRDGLQETFRKHIMPADAIVFSAATKDRFLSARFKMFLDRSFFLGHRPELEGKPVLWLVSGPLKQLYTLRQIIEAHAGISKTTLLGIVTDEQDPESLNDLLAHASSMLVNSIEHPVRKPRMFPAVAGSRTFRDFVYLTRAIFRADHVFYRKTGFYDFPQHKHSQRFADTLLYGAMHIPSIRKKVQKNMKTLMLRPYEKIVGPLKTPPSKKG